MQQRSVTLLSALRRMQIPRGRREVRKYQLVLGDGYRPEHVLPSVELCLSDDYAGEFVTLLWHECARVSFSSNHHYLASIAFHPKPDDEEYQQFWINVNAFFPRLTILISAILEWKRWIDAMGFWKNPKFAAHHSCFSFPWLPSPSIWFIQHWKCMVFA